MALWWERWPHIRQREREALQREGITHRLDEDALREEGILRFHLTTTIDGNDVPLVATYPDTFPYTRFEVAAPSLSLPRHQHPASKNLCLIGRGSENWSAADTLADFVRNRVPMVLRTARNPDTEEAAHAEEHQGEPYTDYYPYVRNATILVDTSWELDPAVKYGELIIGVRQSLLVPSAFQGAVIEVRDERGGVIARLDPDLARAYPVDDRFRGRWIRVAEPIKDLSPPEFLAAVRSRDPRLKEVKWKQVGRGNFDVIGVVFPAEVQWRKMADVWAFAVDARGAGSNSKTRRAHIFRAGPAGRADLSVRIPELGPISSKKIAVVGLGCLGSPSALELGRAGVSELRLLDCDLVEPGTAVRWPLGFTAAGLMKPDALTAFLELNYPYTRVRKWTHRIGVVTGPGLQIDPLLMDRTVLAELLDGVDLVYDATAEVGIQHLLSDLAAERQIPYVCVSTTLGAWGGLIARVRPGKGSGCWVCLQTGLASRDIPSPPADLRGDVQPTGCADPTFTGASFDTMQIALAGVRLAVSTLCAGAQGGYPAIDWDVASVSFRTATGDAIAPVWVTRKHLRHESCEACNLRNAS